MRHLNMGAIWQVSRIAALLALVAGTSGCTSDNQLDSKETKTADEEIRIAIDDGRLEDAGVLLQKQIEAEPEVYRRYALLGGIYARMAGFDLMAAVEEPPTGGGDPIEAVSAFLPDESTEEEIDFMQAALALLNEIPEDERQTDSEEPYGPPAAFQLLLYNTAYSVMLLRQYLVVDPATGNYDPGVLAQMSEAEAEAILAGMLAAAAAGGEDGLGGAAGELAAEIEAAEGETTRERLAAYMASR